MITALARRRGGQSKLLALLFATCLALSSIGAPATAHPFHSTATARISVATHKLNAAGRAHTAADRALVRAARRLKACQARRPRHCRSRQNAVQRAGHRLALSERYLAKLAREGAYSQTNASAAVQAPRLSVSGQILTWTRPGNMNTFVFVRKVPGQEDQYSIIKGNTITPPPVPGYTVRYSIRTDYNGSAWAPEVWISYPAPPAPTTPPTETTPPKETTPPTATTPPTGTTPPVETTPPTTTPPTTTSSSSETPQPVSPPTEPPVTQPVNTQTAPIITVSGQTLDWAKIGTVNTYVFVRKVPGQEDQYSIISGTAITPPVVAGTTVRYSVRTAVQGSAWAPEVTITYPAAGPSPTPEPTPEPTPPVTQPSGGESFAIGVVGGSALSYELPFIEKLGAHTARMEFGINTPASQMASTIEAYAKAGIRPLLLASFYGRLPSPAEAQNLASWAKEFGPGGTLWQGKSFPAGTAATSIEFGNETSYTYQFSNNSSAEYANRAQTYALRLKEAYEAIQAANPQVGLLAQGDNGGVSSEWASNMFKAVPNLGQMVAGWTIHPYGQEWESRIANLISTTQADGAPDTIPIYITEWGLDTDNGRCLEYNFGWNKCMTYSEAASTLASTVSAVRVRFGSRLAGFYLYEAHDQQPTGTSTSLESYFGALQSNGAPKGAYTAEVQSLLAANP